MQLLHMKKIRSFWYMILMDFTLFGTRCGLHNYSTIDSLMLLFFVCYLKVSMIIQINSFNTKIQKPFSNLYTMTISHRKPSSYRKSSATIPAPLQNSLYKFHCTEGISALFNFLSFFFFLWVSHRLVAEALFKLQALSIRNIFSLS